MEKKGYTEHGTYIKTRNLIFFKDTVFLSISIVGVLLAIFFSASKITPITYNGTALV